jgi:hypothetical protein
VCVKAPHAKAKHPKSAGSLNVLHGQKKMKQERFSPSSFKIHGKVLMIHIGLDL